MHADLSSTGKTHALGCDFVQQLAGRGRQLSLDGAKQSPGARGGFQFGEALEPGGERSQRGLHGIVAQGGARSVLRRKMHARQK